MPSYLFLLHEIEYENMERLVKALKLFVTSGSCFRSTSTCIHILTTPLDLRRDDIAVKMLVTFGYPLLYHARVFFHPKAFFQKRRCEGSIVTKDEMHEGIESRPEVKEYSTCEKFHIVSLPATFLPCSDHFHAEHGDDCRSEYAVQKEVVKKVK